MKEADLDEQYARFPEIKRAEVQKFVDWIHAQPHISAHFSEGEALHFFYACKYSMEVAKQVLDTNLTARTHLDDFFVNLDIESNELKRAMKTVSVVPLPGTTPEGYRVIVGKLSDLTTANFNYADVMKLYCMIFDFWMYEDGIQKGHVIVIDLKGCSLGHVARIGLLQMKKFLFYLQEAAALRLIGFHFINIVPFMDKIMALMTPFMKKELTSILYMHSDLNEFFKFVPQKMLPKDYGGPLEEMCVAKELYNQKLMDNRKQMLEFETRHQVNEKLRPGKPKNASDLFGIEGNFKKLDID
ncbi:alpha-tocopherol transfer protein-like [Drosophila nasuta]|uniref:Alpha-tocopherol transfer protein-like n=1 Tax=Drosophila albomicans TaxID=7291 RepID=A0A9C6T1T2_DROAB|nr:alpha-tocopherol transfer protein-like [Drosophila albomicans]XP_060649762.1 alpha-tocopherol transfer protein-like [Drosophila nasuta]